MRQIITSITFILFSLFSLAQSGPVIAGKVSDPAGNPVQGATISVLRAKDSSLLKIFTADQTGKFELERLP